MDFISDSDRNPFGHDPPCAAFVPGYGPTDADFHVIGDNPGLHGGESTGIPFTDRPWSARFFDALQRGGLVDSFDLESGAVTAPNTFFSYLYMCVPDESAPDETDYATLEPFFDAELRAITADVLLPVGPRATAHVLGNYTPRSADGIDMDQLHATELLGSGWLVVPIADPAEWEDGERDGVVDELQALQQTDYRQLSDLGRFSPGDEPYFVR